MTHNRVDGLEPRAEPVSESRSKHISIVMATYNGARFLREQLESLARQTLAPLELVVSDDGSTDDTLAVVEEFARSSQFPVKVSVNERNLGYADNFLAASERADGDYIAFCDQDDVWLPDKISRLESLVEAYPDIALFVHQGLVVDSELASLDVRYPTIRRARKQPPLRGQILHWPPGFAMCFKRSLILDYDWRKRPNDFQFTGSQAKHDVWINTLANATTGIYFEPETLVLYRRHAGSASHFRPGSHLVRRMGQMRDLMRPDHKAHLEAQRRVLADHATYFAASKAPNIPSATLEQAAAVYQRAAAVAAVRLQLIERQGFSRLAVFVRNLRDGAYTEGGRIVRRTLARDAAAVMRWL